MDAPTVPLPDTERRRLWDRRASLPRRAGLDRRYYVGRDDGEPPATWVGERRGGDRRQDERRAQPDRRTHAERRHGAAYGTTPVPYSPQQSAELRARFITGGPVTCPACGGRFTLGPVAPGPSTERLVGCRGCGRAAVISHSTAARVLVVSATQTIRDQLFEMLAGAGHEVVETDDGRVGLDAYQAMPADVVIVDVAAAGRDTGQDFVRRLLRAAPDARLIALSARASWATGPGPLDLSEIPVVRTPLAREVLLRTLQEVRA